MIIVASEVTTQTKIDYDKIVRGVAAKIGFDSCVILFLQGILLKLTVLLPMHVGRWQNLL